MPEITTNVHLVRRGVAPRERGFGTVRLIRSIVQRRALVWEMARREMTDLHAGQVAGIIWLALHPLLMFAVYTFLFSIVFRVRIADRGPSDYLIYLFSGLIPWLLTQDILPRASGVMLANVDIVKKVMFPAEVLVAKTVVSSLTVQSVLLVAVMIYIVITRGAVSLTFVLLPVLFFMHVLLLWGLALLLAAMTPYFRDIPELVRVFVTINIYLMPVVYLPESVPGPVRFVLALNPFSYLIWCYQDVFYFGEIAHPAAWIIFPIVSVGGLVAGSYVFVRLRHHFANVL
jgi:lipopolysaccharide transport system permease protein